MKQFQNYFKSKSKSDYLTQDQVKEMFSQYDIPAHVLDQMMVLSDLVGDRRYNMVAFVLLSYLVFAFKSGVPVPQELPPSLLDSVLSLMHGDGDTKKRRSRAEWELGMKDARVYFDLFMSGAEGDYYPGEKARDLFSLTGLNNDVLARIWGLSDMDDDGKLSAYEFLVASYLLNAASTGRQIPSSLPNILVDSAIEIANSFSSSSYKRPTSISHGSISNLDFIFNQELDLKNLMDKANEAIQVTQEDLLEYGLSNPIERYDASRDIMRLENEVKSVEVAKAVIDQSDPEIKALLLQLEKENALTSSLTDKLEFEENRLRILNTQKDQFLGQYQGYLSKITETENETDRCAKEMQSLLRDIEDLQLQIGNESNIEINAFQNTLNQLHEAYQVIKERYQHRSLEIETLLSTIHQLQSSTNETPLQQRKRYNFQEISL
eukprot:TRINITY_DN6620_c0_g1_i1.p1 TRINITY_DN6620_c0_g1~~TRINITY_DN6620_c0_g1_i1.p1  ORF type:complete len:449 (-),score=96.59 TRINITY_DN6620_c0_g1_i1:15-1319(-)